MSLEQKAKTTREIEMMVSSARNEYRKSKLDQTILAELKGLQDEKWVRLEDARQEIGKLNTELCDKYIEILDNCVYNLVSIQQNSRSMSLEENSDINQPMN